MTQKKKNRHTRHTHTHTSRVHVNYRIAVNEKMNVYRKCSSKRCRRALRTNPKNPKQQMGKMCSAFLWQRPCNADTHKQKTIIEDLSKSNKEIDREIYTKKYRKRQ